MSNETTDYENKKEIFSDLTKEAKALNLKDIFEGHSEEGEEEVHGTLSKKYKDTSDVQVTLREIDKDEETEGGK